MNSRGELWIGTRHSHKKILPNALDYSVGEHVASGETYDEAIVRGFSEELNSQVTSSDLVAIGTLEPSDNDPFFNAHYLYISDVLPPYNSDDFSGFQWVTATQLQNMLQTGTPAKKSMHAGCVFVLDYVRQNNRH